MAVRRNVIPIFVPHLGCPHDCVFCNQRKISGQMRPATAAMVTAEIEEGIKKVPSGDIQVAFYGGSFTAIAASEQESLLSAALPLLNSGKIKSLRVSTRPDAIDESVIERLKRYGVTTVELGVQSMDEEVLRKSNRGHTRQDAVLSAKMLKEAGFELILQMMTGLPGDTLEKSLRTAHEIASLNPDGVRVYPTVVIKDTELCELWERREYKEHSVDEAVAWCAQIMEVFETENIPVIRLGLNPTDDLSGGEAVAGAYHPAFGELVYSEIYLNKARALLEGKANGAELAELAVPKGQLSQAVGQHRRNRLKLQTEFNIKKIKFVESDLPNGEIAVLNIAKNS